MSLIKVVIIDDEYFNRELISLLIHRYSKAFEVTGSASSMREGVRLIEETKPQAVFLDIKMPDGSGFDLLQKFDSTSFEIIFVTGFDNYEQRAIEERAFDYILKPIDLDKFRECLEKLEKRLTDPGQNPPY